jgi:hypothetical protein
VYDLLQIGWRYDFVYDTNIERLHIQYDYASEFVYESVYDLVSPLVLSPRKAFFCFPEY